MKWLIPAKTFLLGEYAAVAEASAIVLTTTPCFQLSHNTAPGLVGIHPQSPAGLWWQQQKNIETGLSWHDPYAGIGGVGASSAQFLASYLASRMLQEKRPDMDSMLEAYYQSSWTGKGLRPSGYDVIAQSQHGCVYINRQKEIVQCYNWPFHNLSFFLIHTGVKLATHHHLQDTALPTQIDYLSNLVDMAKNAFEQQKSEQLIACINNYHAKLVELGLVAQHSLELINQFKSYPEVLAIKGCGALGADIILLLTSRSEAPAFESRLQQENHTLLATENLLNFSQPLLPL